MALPTLDDVKTELDIDLADKTDDAKLQRLLDSAAEIVTDRVDPAFLPLATNTGPAMETALIELVRDLWASGGPRDVGAEGEGTPVYGTGRPLLPPYVRGLLRPYLRKAQPSGTFPLPAPERAW